MRTIHFVSEEITFFLICIGIIIKIELHDLININGCLALTRYYYYYSNR